MQTWVIDIMEQFGYLGILLMMALENLFPPIPSEVILPFAGFMTVTSKLTILGVVITSTTGAILGAIILYGVGMLINVHQLEKFADRWGYLVRLKREDIQKANNWFNQRGYWTVLFCRMIPIVRSLISIPAGMAKMEFWVFLLFTMIGTVIWNVLLISAGVLLGNSWTMILGVMDAYSEFARLVLGIGIIILVLFFIFRKRRKKVTK